MHAYKHIYPGAPISSVPHSVRSRTIDVTFFIIATPALLCHKEPVYGSRHPKPPTRGIAFRWHKRADLVSNLKNKWRTLTPKARIEDLTDLSLMNIKLGIQLRVLIRRSARVTLTRK